MYFLGVDGGGTKTKYLLINQELRVICDVESGTTHIHQIGKEKLIEVLNENLELICEKGCINKNEIEYAFLGIPGYGESKSDIEDIEYSVKKVFDGINYVIGNDSVVGWAAGTGCKEGITIVAGTGSIAYGRNKKGNEARCGGWGPGIGDDASAYWIGLKILNEYTKQKDGRNEKTVLVDTLEKEYNIKDYFEIVDIAFNRLKFSRTDIAKFSEIAYLAASAGCETCRNIFKEAAKELFFHIKVLKNELNLENGFLVSYSGGVFKAGEFILNPLKEMLKNDKIECILIEPKLKPWHGAALLAYLLSDNELPDNYIELIK